MAQEQRVTITLHLLFDVEEGFDLESTVDDIAFDIGLRLDRGESLGDYNVEVKIHD